VLQVFVTQQKVMHGLQQPTVIVATTSLQMHECRQGSDER